MNMNLLDHSPKSVAILGMGPSLVGWLQDTLTQELTIEWADEVWAINMAANACWHDVVFWMDDLKDQEEFRPPLFELLRKRGRPIITSIPYPDIVESYGYPLGEVVEISLEILGKPYLNNGVAMAVAYAVWKQVKRIRIYGADFTYPNRTYGEQGRACTEFWLQVAMNRGAEVSMPHNTSLFDTHGDTGIYGYKEQPLIHLPNGDTYKYLTEAEVGSQVGYKPEDSSGTPGIVNIKS